MKTATTSELRQELSRVLGWVEQGEEVEITRRGRVVARLVPASPAPPQPQKIKMPGFESSLRKLLGED